MKLARLLLVALFFLFWGTDAVPSAQAEHARLFETAAQEVDVPAELTQAIARVESGGSPWALNIEGRGYIYASREEALAAAREASAAGQSFDSGIMQVNNWWLKRYGIPLEAMFDPAANILLGSWILRQELDQAGDVWTAVARYHSPHAGRGKRYADLVRQALERGPVQTVEHNVAARRHHNAKTKKTKTTQTGALHRAAPHGEQMSEESRQVFHRSAGTVLPAADSPLLVYRRTAFTRVPLPEDQEDVPALYSDPADPVFVRRLR